MLKAKTIQKHLMFIFLSLSCCGVFFRMNDTKCPLNSKKESFVVNYVTIVLNKIKSIDLINRLQNKS